MAPDTLNWLSFLQVIALPAFAGVLYALRELYKRQEEHQAESHESVAELRSQVQAWQLETFKTYATKQDVTELRTEVREGFATINSKLDRMLGGRAA